MTITIIDLPFVELRELLKSHGACTPAVARIEKYQFSASDAWEYARDEMRGSWMRWALQGILSHARHIPKEDIEATHKQWARAERMRERHSEWLHRALGAADDEYLTMKHVTPFEERFARISQSIDRMYTNALFECIQWKEK